MITTLLRIIRYGIQGVFRNGLVSIATVVVMTLALLVAEGLIVFGVLTNTAVVSLQDKIDISAYFKTTVSEDEILALEKAIEGLTEVKSVEYVSREKALEIFEEKYQDEETISQALDELDENPLLASLNIKAHDPDDYATIASYLEDDALAPLIEKVTFTQSRLAIERLAKIVETVQQIGIALTIFLALTAALVTFNTIRLAIYSNREEIAIMRLVGAPNLFINGPYIVEGVLFGVAAAVLALVISGPFLSFASPYVSAFIPEMNLHTYFFAELFRMLAYLLLLGTFLGVVSGMVAIRRYLKT